MTDPREPAWDEHLLRTDARTTTYPATPSLSAAVDRRVSGPAATRSARRMPLALAAAAAVAAIGLLFAAWGEARTTVADLFGFSVPGQRVELLPTPAPGVVPTPLPAPPELEVIATPATFAEARDALGMPLLLPAGEPPTTAYLLTLGGEPAVILHYRDFDLWQVTDESGGFGKGIGQETVVDEVTVNGAPGLWIAGGRRLVTYLDEGEEHAGMRWTVERNTLVWRKDGVTYRIETEGGLDAALAFATSLEPDEE